MQPLITSDNALGQFPALVQELTYSKPFQRLATLELVTKESNFTCFLNEHIIIFRYVPVQQSNLFISYARLRLHLYRLGQLRYHNQPSRGEKKSER